MNPFKKIIDGFISNTAKIIKLESIVEIDADNKHSHGYYMIELSSSPYTFQENKTIGGKVADTVELL